MTWFLVALRLLCCLTQSIHKYSVWSPDVQAGSVQYCEAIFVLQSTHKTVFAKLEKDSLNFDTSAVEEAWEPCLKWET